MSDEDELIGCPRGFTLIELLVTVAVLALLIAILLPSLTSAREASRASLCQSNLRQMFLACRMYADCSKGFGPALGEPYTRFPNWAVVVQRYAGVRRLGDAVFSPQSLLVCPSIQLAYPEVMTRTYGTNVTGHAGLTPGESSFDDPDRMTHVRMDAILRPAYLPITLDSARTTYTDDGPPSPRTASVIDFRQPSHVDKRVGWFHCNRKAFQAAMYDGSAGACRHVPMAWSTELP